MLSVTLNASDVRRWFAALKRVELAVRFQAEDMQRRCALEHKVMLSDNILSNRYAMGYPRYNRRYANWKYRTLRRKGFVAGSYWVLTRTMVRSIGVKRIGKNKYHSGIVKGSMAPSTSWFSDTFGTRGSVPVDFYARINEFGGRRHPARPVFTPTMREYASSKWRGQGMMSLRSIGSKWR